MMDDFEARLDRLLEERRSQMKDAYHRVLPTGELLYNRFDKAKALHAGEGSSIYDTSVIMGDVSIGQNVWIGPYTLIEGINGQVTIGDYVSIDAGVMIYAHDSTLHYLSHGKNPFVKGNVTIGSCTVIGSQCVVSCGVTIGSHTVIAANSFVNRDVPDNAIAAGNPAKVIGKVNLAEDGTASLEYFPKDVGS